MATNKIPPPPLGKVSKTKITVRGYTLDMYQQVSNSKFMELLDEAKWNHYDGLFESGIFLDLDLALVLVNINVDYRRPAYLGEVFDIYTSVKRVGEKSITLKQDCLLRPGKDVILEAEVTYVVKDLKKGAAVPLVGKMREMLTRGE